MNEPRDNWKTEAWIAFAAFLFVTIVWIVREAHHNAEIEEAIARVRANTAIPSEYNDPHEGEP